MQGAFGLKLDGKSDQCLKKQTDHLGIIFLLFFILQSPVSGLWSCGCDSERAGELRTDHQRKQPLLVNYSGRYLFW